MIFNVHVVFPCTQCSLCYHHPSLQSLVSLLMIKQQLWYQIVEQVDH